MVKRRELWPRPCTCRPGLELGLERCRGAASCLFVPVLPVDSVGALGRPPVRLAERAGAGSSPA